MYLGSSLKWGQELKRDGLVFGHKIQSRNPVKYFIMNKQIVCKDRSL